jgi:hypothetical protein
VNKIPILVFCDQNFLIGLGRQGEPYQERLKGLLAGQKVRFVLSPWHWVEMARGKNPTASLALADYAESLEPLWVRERRTLQKNEVAAALFGWLGVPYTKLDPLASRAEVIADINRQPVAQVAQVTSRDFVGYLRSSPTAMDPIVRGYEENLKAVEVLRKARREGRLTPEVQQRADRELVRRSLPDYTPSGLKIDDTTKREFLGQVDLQRLPTIAAEISTSQYGWDSPRLLTHQEHIDRLHAVCALPHVDLIGSDDIELTKTIIALKSGLRFQTACPITRSRFEQLYRLEKRHRGMFLEFWSKLVQRFRPSAS